MDEPRWKHSKQYRVVETGLYFDGRQIFLQAGPGEFYDSDLAEELRRSLAGTIHLAEKLSKQER